MRSQMAGMSQCGSVCLKKLTLTSTIMSGKLIASQIVEGAEVDFDISHMAQGVYMVRVQTNDEIITEQVVKH